MQYPQYGTAVLTYAFVNLKPGVGKSTSSVFLAAALHEQGDDPLLVDADKGASALRWDELAGGLGFPVVGKASRTLYTALPDLARGRGAVVLDVPQVEDHAVIARGALRFADTWILPIAAKGIEVDRMLANDILRNFLDDTQSLRDRPADVVVLLNRTNTRHATKTGPDADVREVLQEKEFHVLDTQIPNNDGRYGQTFGLPVRALDTPYRSLLHELKARQKRGA